MAMCAGVQNESRPIERCQAMSQCVPTMAEVTASTASQRYHGTADPCALVIILRSEFGYYYPMWMRRIPLFLLLASITLAQVAPTGSLVGEVSDSSGAVIPGASVVLINTGTQARKETATGPGGRFAFPLLPVGAYQLKATANGFAAYEQTGIRVDVDSSPSVSVALRVGAMTEQVT